MPQLVTANFAVTLADFIAPSATDLLSYGTSTVRTLRQSLAQKMSQDVIPTEAT